MSLSSDQYVDGGGVVCPHCESDQVQTDGAVEIDGPIAWQNCRCTKCGATWTDELKLCGYSHLGVPAEYEYASLQKCLSSGKHLTNCDDDGYCNLCGHQEVK